jgi:hypothetical protein
MVRQSRQWQPNVRETRELTWANRVALGTRQARNTEGESIADEEEGDTGEMEMEGAEVENDVTMSETNVESEMGATASNDLRNRA